MEEKMDKPFVRLANSEGRMRIVNVMAIAQIFESGSGWRVMLTNGHEFTLDEEEFNDLLPKMPGATAAKAGMA